MSVTGLGTESEQITIDGKPLPPGTGEIRTIVEGGTTVIDARNVPGAGAGAAGGAGTAAGSGAASSADPLKKLSDLRESGALTEAEFEAHKAKLLGEL